MLQKYRHIFATWELSQSWRVGSGRRNLVSFEKSSFQITFCVISDMSSELERVGRYV